MLSYSVAKDNGCSNVYLFDAHADLGYGGLPSLNFELNCVVIQGRSRSARTLGEKRISQIFLRFGDSRFHRMRGSILKILN